MANPLQPHQLVTFDKPPVEEVAFAVQLTEAQLAVEDFAAIGGVLRDELPVRQVQPSLPRMADPVQGPVFTFGPVNVSLPRFWFVSADGHRLMQVQEDRIAFNWRRLGREVEYPRYASLRAEFVRILGNLAEKVPALGQLRADFCEVTYVNELAGQPSVGHVSLDRVLRVARPLPRNAFLPAPIESQWAAAWQIQPTNGRHSGRLSAEARPVLRQRDNRPIYLLTMTAAMPGEVMGQEQVLGQLDVAHEWVVRGFADLTTKTMHEEWERTQ